MQLKPLRYVGLHCVIVLFYLRRLLLLFYPVIIRVYCVNFFDTGASYTDRNRNGIDNKSQSSSLDFMVNRRFLVKLLI